MHEFRPPSLVETDTALALAFREGDESAVQELYGRYGRLVFAISMRILGDRGHADEVTQQTFLQAWRNSDRFEPGRDFAPWLATIARRAAIDVQRRERRRSADALDRTDPGDPNLVNDAPDAAAIEMTWAVRAAVDALEPAEREIARLQHLEGYTHAEIADLLGIALGTVKSRSFRAHRRLAQRLGHLRDDSEDRT